MAIKTNIITALLNLHYFKNNLVNDFSETNNRINKVGSSLENYVKNLFIDRNDRTKNSNDYFSYEGAQNNPPDLILKEGDAFEIKKIGTVTATDIQLNSSYPKNTLKIDDPKLTEECRNCEFVEWKEKDIFYVIGHVDNKKLLKSIFFIQGPCLACSPDHYESLFNNFKQHIYKGNFTFSDTKEIARLNKIDPLDYTNLRVRAMFLMKNPFKIFDFCNIKKNSNMNVFCLMTDKKYSSFKEHNLHLLEQNTDIKINDIQINSPMDKNQFLNCKFIQLHL